MSTVPLSAPPLMVSLSAPAPRSTLPKIAAPAPTVTVASAAVSTIAARPTAPIAAPLASATLTLRPLATSVRKAAAEAPVPPVTEPESAMTASPLPS